MDKELASIINNLIDKLPVILPSVVTIITLVVGYKATKRQSSLNLITAKKIEWRDTMRNELANFIRRNNELIHIYFIYRRNKPDDLKPLSSMVSKILADGHKLILGLDPHDDKKIIDIIKGILDCAYLSHDNLDKTTDKWKTLALELTTESHLMLKDEWEKIKIEAGHKKPMSIFGAFKKRP